MKAPPRLRPEGRDLIFFKRLFQILIVAAFVTFLYKTTDLLLLVFGSAMGAVLLSAVADGIAEHSRFSRKIGLLVAVVLLVGGFVLIGWLFGAELSHQFDRMMQRLPKVWESVEQRLSTTAVGRWVVTQVNQAGTGTGLAAYLAKFGKGAVDIFVNFLIVVVGAIMFAAQPRLYRNGLLCLVPLAYRGVAGDALDDCGRTLKLWLLTQVVLMTTMGTLVGVGLWIAGVPSALSLGVLAGLSEFIPYVGPTLAMVPPLVIALAGEGSVLGVLGVFAAVRLVQSSALTPMVQRKVVSVPPAITLFVILAFGYAFGTFGLFFSAPLLVVGYTLVGRLYLRETLAEPLALPGEEETVPMERPQEGQG